MQTQHDLTIQQTVSVYRPTLSITQSRQARTSPRQGGFLIASRSSQERGLTMLHDSSDETFLSGITQQGAAPHDKHPDERQRALPSGPQPVIGIPIPVLQDAQGPCFCADALGPWAIERMLGRVLLIPLWPFPTHQHVYQSLWPLLQSMDGLLLPAAIQGNHWFTHWQERERHPGADTWPLSWEIALAHLATFIGMPLLAIADGAEKWNTALGGSRKAPSVETVQPPPTPPETWDRHRIRVRLNSTLASSLFPTLATPQETSHPWELAFAPHQGIARLADGLRSCAQSDDIPIVAFERRDAAFGLGIVGRLDWGLDHPYGITIFAAFIQASKTFHQTRQQDQGWEARRDEICAEVSTRVTQGRSLLSAPQAPKARQPPQPTPQHSGPRDTISTATSAQERLRQRAHPLTKAELNQRRRQRLKAASR